MHVRKRTFTWSAAFVVAVLTVFMSLSASFGATSGTATVTTDKTKYSVGETMIISGSGFTASGEVDERWRRSFEQPGRGR